MTRFTATFAVAALAVLAAASTVSAHGYLSSPPPRGIEKEGTQVDALKAPNTSGKICRGEPAGKVTPISGSSITLGFTITAPHIGNCEVFLLDTNLGNPQKIGAKQDCAAPGKVGPMTVQIPAGVSGRKVLHWVWKATQQGPNNIELYEQCADINIAGGGGGGNGGDGGDGGDGGADPAPAPKKPGKGKPKKGGKAKLVEDN